MIVESRSFAFTKFSPERGRPSYYSKDLHEFQLKRASFTDNEERDRFVKERQALVVQMEKVMVVSHAFREASIDDEYPTARCFTRKLGR